MTYEAFIEEIKKIANEEFGFPLEMMEFYPKGYTSDDLKTIRMIKQCNQVFSNEDSFHLLEDFLILKMLGKDGTKFFHRVATRRIYEKSQELGFDAAIKPLRDQLVNAPDADISRVQQLRAADYEAIRDQLIVRPKNCNMYRKAIENGIYRKIGDIALIVYQLISDTKGARIITMVQRDELIRWNMDENQVIDAAIANTSRLYPPCVFARGREENFLEGEFTKKDISFMGVQTIMSVLNGSNGVISLFYPGVVEKMLTIMGDPFIAIFMNVNDVLIADLENPMLRTFIKSAGERNPEGEFLSGRIYLCSSDGIRSGTKVRFLPGGGVRVD